MSFTNYATMNGAKTTIRRLKALSSMLEKLPRKRFYYGDADE